MCVCVCVCITVSMFVIYIFDYVPYLKMSLSFLSLDVTMFRIYRCHHVHFLVLSPHSSTGVSVFLIHSCQRPLFNSCQRVPYLQESTCSTSIDVNMFHSNQPVTCPWLIVISSLDVNKKKLFNRDVGKLRPDGKYLDIGHPRNNTRAHTHTHTHTHRERERERERDPDIQFTKRRQFKKLVTCLSSIKFRNVCH